jgi:chromate transporter
MTAALPLLMAATCRHARLSDLATLAKVIWEFMSLSLFSLGGGNTLLAEYHHLTVDKFCWLTNSQFADLYALAEAAPGPSSMIVGLLGLGAGWPDGPFWALLSGYGAEIAILLPSTLLMVMACLSWRHLEHSPWRHAFERGMGPITLGILFAVGLKILSTADSSSDGRLSIPGVIVSLVVCGLMLRTRISPLWFMGCAGVLGAFGIINR